MSKLKSSNRQHIESRDALRASKVDGIGMVWCVDSPALTSARTQANQKERSTGDSIRDNSSTTKIHLIIIETAPLISRTDFALFASWLTYQGRKAVVNICQWSPM
jgi:hypothetical protein